MDFEKQVKNIKIHIINNPRIFIEWNNTEKGRDEHECYERFDKGLICYVNFYNPNIKVFKDDAFFNELEEMYNKYKNYG